MSNTHTRKRSSSFTQRFLCHVRLLRYVVLDILFPLDSLERDVELLTEEILAKHLSIRVLENDITALFHYHDPLVRKTVWFLKYRGDNNVARLFGNILYEYLIEELSDREIFEDFTHPIFVPIPLSIAREKERGFNQAVLVIQRSTDDFSDIGELNQKALFKVRDTEPQTSLHRNERLSNLKGAFNADSRAVFGRNIILLDDVATTGSTMREARTTLLSAGARSVHCIVLAA